MKAEVLKPRAEAASDAPGSSTDVPDRRTSVVGYAFPLRLEIY